MEESFEKVLDENKLKIYRICRIYAVAPLEAQDLFQEVVFQLWKSFSSFKGNSSVDTWVYKVALNVCLRSKVKMDKSNDKTERFESINFIPVATAKNTSEEERYQYLKECISTLDESDASILTLYLEDLPYKKIALITGLSENHIAVKMKRIRAKLFDCITPKFN